MKFALACSLLTASVLGVGELLFVVVDQLHEGPQAINLTSGTCFSRHTEEPWDHTPYGKIEAVGINYVLISTYNPSRNRWNDIPAWEVSKDSFIKAYKEVPCAMKPTS